MKVGLGDWIDRPFRARGLMGVPLTQAFSLGFVISPLWGSNTWTSLDRLPFASLRAGSWGSKTTADLARLGFVVRYISFPFETRHETHCDQELSNSPCRPTRRSATPDSSEFRLLQVIFRWLITLGAVSACRLPGKPPTTKNKFKLYHYLHPGYGNGSWAV